MEHLELIAMISRKLPDKITVSDFLLIAIVITVLCGVWRYFFGN